MHEAWQSEGNLSEQIPHGKKRWRMSTVSAGIGHTLDKSIFMVRMKERLNKMSLENGTTLFSLYSAQCLDRMF
jgi:hypothetical protein